MPTFTIYQINGTISDPLFSTTGSGNPRLYEGVTTSYIYACSSALWETADGWFTATNIIPSVAFGFVHAMSDGFHEDTVVVANTGYYITIFHQAGSGLFNTTAHTHKVNTILGWATTSGLAPLFRASDAVQDDLDIQPILVGNTHVPTSGSEPRIERSNTEVPTVFVDSSTGLPTTSGSAEKITDLEMNQ